MRADYVYPQGRGIGARVIEDTIFESNRIITIEGIVPKSIIAQINTTRMFCRDSASSRAIPTRRIIAQVQDDPYEPHTHAGGLRYRNPEGGMVPGGLLSPEDTTIAIHLLDVIRRSTLYYVQQLDDLRVAKEEINRYLEPWMWSTVVITATEWENWFSQRLAEDAQSAHRIFAEATKEAISKSIPREAPNQMLGRRISEQWHLPYVTPQERETIDIRMLPAISAARCASVSYYPPEEAPTLHDHTKEIERTRNLVAHKHWSPVEMPAMAASQLDQFFGPYRGWQSYRSMFAGESGSPHFGTQKTRGLALYLENDDG